MLTNRAKIIMSIILALSTLIACRSTKDNYSTKWVARSDAEVIEALNGRKLTFDYAELKGSVYFDSPEQSGSGSLQIRMKSDSIIWFVIKKMSIEALRGQILKDSFYLLNRIDKTLEKGKITEFNTLFPMMNSISDYQHLILGNFSVDTEKTKVAQEDYYYCVHTSQGTSKYKYYLTSSDLILRRVHITTRESDFIVTFGKYKNIKTWQNIPMSIKIEERNQYNQKTTSEITFKEINFTKILQLPFSIPGHYTNVYR